MRPQRATPLRDTCISLEMRAVRLTSHRHGRPRALAACLEPGGFHELDRETLARQRFPIKHGDGLPVWRPFSFILGGARAA
jgi:hypothetical protein